MAKKEVENEQIEMFPECTPEGKKKLRRLLGKMESFDAEKKAAKEKYDDAEQDVVAFVRDEEKIMPDKDGNYRLRLDADETIVIGHGKSKVTIKRVSNKEADADPSNDEDFPDATEGAEPDLKPRKGKAES